jgi:anthranilate/para-aminobenzoate synthase component II
VKILIIHQHDHLAQRLYAFVAHQAKEVAMLTTLPDAAQAQLYDKWIWTAGAIPPPELLATAQQWQTYTPLRPLLCIGSAAVAMAQAFGSTSQLLTMPDYAESKSITQANANTNLWRNMPRELEVGVYQSYTIQKITDTLLPTAKDKQGQPLAWRHRDQPTEGILFHPATTLTPQGEALLSNWLA